jgi:hypothetical protein
MSHGMTPVDAEPAHDMPASVSARSWSERRDVAVIALGYVMLALVVAGVGLMSWSGLVRAAVAQLHLTGWRIYAVPVSLDVAGATSAFLTLRSVVKGDSALVPRLLTLAFVAGSAALNWWSARLAFGTAASELFYAGMSVAAWALWDVVLRQIQRDVLRARGAVERPLPRFRFLRWVRFPSETWALWSIAIRENLTRPEDARLALHGTSTNTVTVDQIDLSTLDKASALSIAFGAVGGPNVPAALAWLSARNIAMDRSYAYAIARQLRGAPELSPVSGEASA